MFGRTRRDNAMSVYLNTAKGKKALSPRQLGPEEEKSTTRRERKRSLEPKNKNDSRSLAHTVLVDRTRVSFSSVDPRVSFSLVIHYAKLSEIRYGFLSCRDARPKSSTVTRASRPVTV